MRRQLYRQCLLRTHLSLFSACGHLTRLSCYSLFQAPDSRAKGGQARTKENRGVSWEGAFPRPPSSFFRSRSPAFRPNDREHGKQTLLNLSSSILDLSHVLRGRADEKERSPAALVAGFTGFTDRLGLPKRASSLVLKPASPPTGCRRNTISSTQLPKYLAALVASQEVRVSWLKRVSTTLTIRSWAS